MIILVMPFVMVATKWIKNHIWAFTIQAWVLSVMAVMIGFHLNQPTFYVLAIVSAIVRGILLPYLFLQTHGVAASKREADLSIPIATGTLICLGFFLLSSFVAFRLTSLLGLTGHDAMVNTIAVSAMLTMFMMGFFVLVTRHFALSKIIALLLMENAILLGSLVISPNAGLFVALIVLFDLFIAVFSFYCLSGYLMEQWGHTDNRYYKKLIG